MASTAPLEMDERDLFFNCCYLCFFRSATQACYCIFSRQSPLASVSVNLIPQPLDEVPVGDPAQSQGHDLLLKLL